MAKFTSGGEWNISTFFPSTLLVRLFLMASCSVATLGFVVLIPHLELKCVKHVQEVCYANSIRQMLFSSGFNKIQGSRGTPEQPTLGLHLILAKR